MKDKPAKLTRYELAEIIADTLELKPILRGYRTKQDSYRILGAIIKSITDCLQRGENVSIPGFGTFDVRTHAPRRHKLLYVHGNTHHMEYKVFPEKKYVVFIPSTRHLKRMLKEYEAEHNLC